MRTSAICFFLLILSAQSAPVLLAKEYDIKQMTPAIERAFSGRQSRHAELESLKAAGRIGEDARGYAAALDQSRVVDSLVNAENTDRRVIYQAIVEQNGLGPNGLVQVEAVFAAVKRDKARPGDSIQLPSGEWTRK